MESPKQLSLGTWIAMGTLALSVLTGGTIWITSNVATKAELLEKTSKNDVRDWRLQAVEVRVENLELRNERIDKNLDELLKRFRVAAVPQPDYKEIPEPPIPMEKDQDVLRE